MSIARACVWLHSARDALRERCTAAMQYDPALDCDADVPVFGPRRDVLLGAVDRDGHSDPYVRTTISMSRRWRQAMTTATKGQAESFLQFMSSHFGARIVRRKDAPEFSMFKEFLESLGMPSSSLDTVLRGRSMTVDRFIYLDDQITDDDSYVIATHECQHVHQEDANGFLRNAWRYIAYSEIRTQLETDGYIAGAEMCFARWKRLPSVKELSSRMVHGYMLSGNDLDLAEDLFEQRLTSIAMGLVSTEAAKIATQWMRANQSELLS